MAMLKHATQPNRYIRVERNFAGQGISERSRVVETTYDENGNVLVEEHTEQTPATTLLTVGWREWRSPDDRELNKTTVEVWSKPDSKAYPSSQIVLPPPTWTPKADSPEDPVTQYFVAMVYLTMLADPRFASEWVSDES